MAVGIDPQNYPHHPTKILPENQFDWNPIAICRAYYDPVEKDVVNSTWDTSEKKILIAGNIWYERKSNGSVRVWVDEDDWDPITVRGEIFPQQGGGYNDNHLIDGGVVDGVADVDISSKFGGIHILYNSLIKNPLDKITLDTNSSDFIVFFNGIMYKKDVDWSFNTSNHTLTFLNQVLVPDRRLFIFQNIQNSSSGYLKQIYSNLINGNPSSLTINGLSPSKKYLVFIDGLLRKDVLISNNVLTAENLKNGGWILILEVIEGKNSKNNVQVIYDGLGQDSSLYKNSLINSARGFLVFYNGVLYHEND